MQLPNIVGTLKKDGTPGAWPKMALDGRPYRKQSCTWVPVFERGNGLFEYFVVVPVNYLRSHTREDIEEMVLHAFEDMKSVKEQKVVIDEEAKARAAERLERLDMVIGNVNSEDSNNDEEEVEEDDFGGGEDFPS